MLTLSLQSKEIDYWLPRNRFYHIQGNAGPEISVFCDLLNQVWLAIWLPGGVLVIDESLWEFLGLSPNHVNIPRKPHPNGHVVY